MPDRVLVLWDPDLLFVNLRELTSVLLPVALERHFREPLAVASEAPGRTALAVLLDLLTDNGRSADSNDLNSCWMAVAATAVKLQERTKDAAQPAPGAAEAVTALSGHHGVMQSFVTADVRFVVETKLWAFGPADQFDRYIAVFGDEAVDHAALIQIAHRRTKEVHDLALADDQVVVIGEQPRDIEAAHRVGARSVCVATGDHSMDELASAGASAVLPDLSDPARLTGAVFGLSPN